jgi:lysozyme
MTNKQFFEWLRQQQTDKRLTQGEVDAANALLEYFEPAKLKEHLIELNRWHDGLKLSNKGLELIKQFEGFRSAPYRDAVGVWTVGYGNTYYPNGRKVSGSDKPLTIGEANQLKLDIINKDFAPAVNTLLADEIKAGKVNQNMFDALVSLSYNIGTGSLSRSSVIRHLKQGNKQKAADAFLLWVKAGGRTLNGLVRRREAERKLFLS